MAVPSIRRQGVTLAVGQAPGACDESGIAAIPGGAGSKGDDGARRANLVALSSRSQAPQFRLSSVTTTYSTAWGVPLQSARRGTFRSRVCASVDLAQSAPRLHVALPPTVRQ